MPYGQALQTECAMSADDVVIHGKIDMLSKVIYGRGRCDIGQVCIMPLCLLSEHCLFTLCITAAYASQ